MADSGLGQCLGGSRESELEFRSGECGHWEQADFQQFGSVLVHSVVLTALAEPSALVHELPAEKLEVCSHHILPLTLHPILAPFRSALVELEEKWKQTGIILMETCFAGFGFFNLNLPDVVQRAEIRLSKTLQSLPSWAFDFL